MNKSNTTPKTGLNITKPDKGNTFSAVEKEGWIGGWNGKYWDVEGGEFNTVASGIGSKEDAELIADAFNTANETGLLPSQLAEILREHEWISVSDRMPEKEQRIMVTEGCWIGFATYTKNTWTNNRYAFLDEQDEQPGTVYGVTHWKPIPSLP